MFVIQSDVKSAIGIKNPEHSKKPLLELMKDLRYELKKDKIKKLNVQNPNSMMFNVMILYIEW